MLAVIPAVATALTGGFGQFAIGHSHTLPAFDVSPTEFTARAPNAITIKLGPERTGFVVKSLSRFGKSLAIRPAPLSPTQIEYEATSLGFGMRYVAGMKWEGTGDAPFVTWADGTVGPGVPSAPASWALLTWASERPPLLLSFSNPASLLVSKTQSGFKLEAADWTGSVSVRLPFGTRTVTTRQAADFGALLSELRPSLDIQLAPAPQPVSAIVRTVTAGYEVAVMFDRPGAAVPPAAADAAARGLVAIGSPLLQNGPKDMPLCSTSELRFVVRSARAATPGTPITFGAVPTNATSEEARLLGYLTGTLNQTDSMALASLQPMVAMYTEPVTGIGLPLASDGSGSYRTALRGAVFLAQGRSAGFLDSMFAGVDWVTWQPTGATAEERANTAAAIAIAGPFCTSIDNRALAAMANAGLRLPTGFDAFRNGLYTADSPPGWVVGIYSPVKVVTPGVVAAGTSGGLQVKGVAESIESFDLTLASDVPLQVANSENVDRTMVIATGPRTTVRVRPKRAGEWSIIFRRSEGASPIPKASPGPRYSEAQR